MKSFLLAFASFALAVGAAQAQIFSNGTGGGAFTTGSTWIGGVAPTAAQSWIIQATDIVTATASLTPSTDAAHTINGTFNMAAGAHYNIVGGGVTLNINGSLTTERIFTNGSIANSTARITLSGGSLTITNRLHLIASNTTNTAINKFTLSGGTVDLSAASGGFKLYGADADDRAQFTVIGNAGTFNATGREVALYNTTVGFENSAAAINFTFGSTAGAGAVTVVNSGLLTFSNNQFTIDFTSIARPLTTTSYSTTLFDYTSFSGLFTAANLTSIGLGAGESAMLVKDDINKLIRVDYTLTSSIPEPSTFAFVLGLLALGFVSLRRRGSKN
ncbi:hypothetical protein [Rariglobus hedericola]|uniref:PEP-CTERM sorting domain-containing protein n=1 Tax=Rariglobus hedericola TaxID=2597822 RepID=A0A556QPG3_9BACT|nr:hypothetical protein [Rariglobus hedericola]TSJ78519.1 hypothetical protein FPL22_04260 [Rariglobus hedericola]